ncbi:MAG TPA: hypothetical protein PKZ84_08685 [Anaerolineae bacterium]|nr:hypothetical protein [Anaerolineae bacterium]HQI84458.1 hypothetical protein [Anaerolineae bacterium]
MSSDMPDWLSELVSVSDDDEPLQKAAPASASVMPLIPDASPPQRARPPEPAPANVDLMDDLRSQVAAQEAAPAVAPKKARPRSRYVAGGLLPWQAFFLSVLLFLDVAVIGLLFLVMLGRIVP